MSNANDLRGLPRICYAILRNAYEDGRRPAWFAGASERRAVRSLIERGIATDCGTEIVGGTEWLMAKLVE